MTIEAILDNIVGVEGGYTDNPKDSGGETIWGITVAVARQYGYAGDMRLMSKEQAKNIYRRRYIMDWNLDQVYSINRFIGHEVIDTGVNLGQAVAITFLQRALNSLNKQEHLYPDITVDGRVGKKTLDTLKAYLAKRGKLGEVVLLRVLNSLQGEHYVRLAEKREKDEEFIFGWFANRVVI